MLANSEHLSFVNVAFDRIDVPPLQTNRWLVKIDQAPHLPACGERTAVLC